MINNNVLIVAGCLVGASGLILSIIMCKAMNRTLSNVLFGSFGAATGKTGKVVEGEMKAASAEDAYYVLEAAQSVIFVPGYGMAVAQAQHAVKELGGILEANGAEVRYAIHPVAGRMPGHMNVLLAEADVPYEQLAEMDDVNPIMSSVDVFGNDVLGGDDNSSLQIEEDLDHNGAWTIRAEIADSEMGRMHGFDSFEACSVVGETQGADTDTVGLENSEWAM